MANTIWRDTAGNMVRLQINASSTWLTLAYISHNADERINSLGQAFLVEKTKKEDILRLENTNNVDGL